jgi:FemAB-related protein (PEP-CTERM system-associated)
VETRTYEDGPDAWDRFVRASERWTHFHLHGWKSVIEDVFGHECPYLVARHDGAITGVLPLVRVKSRIFGHFLVSMPFLNYGGPLGSEDAVRALVDEAAGMAEDSGATLLELRSRHPLDVPLPVSHRKITVVRELFEDPEEVWADLKAKVRSQIRRPMKEGIEVRFGETEIGPFHQVFSRHMRDLGTPCLPESLFRRAAAEFGDTVWFGCAYLDDRPVAGGCGFRWGDEVEMTWASALREYNRMAPNMLLYWSFMERAATEGVSLFNFGRCTPDGPTHRFKRQWGGRDEPLCWYYRASGTRSSTPSPEQSAYAWGPRLWRKLPLAVTRRLGPRVVRYIP